MDARGCDALCCRMPDVGADVERAYRRSLYAYRSGSPGGDPPSASGDESIGTGHAVQGRAGLLPASKCRRRRGADSAGRNRRSSSISSRASAITSMPSSINRVAPMDWAPHRSSETIAGLPPARPDERDGGGPSSAIIPQLFRRLAGVRRARVIATFATASKIPLRLTQIKLAGFKSFVDPTVDRHAGSARRHRRPQRLRQINVIDAVRWVLGESKASALRGESMQDVIFNGAGDRKPVGRASVELYLRQQPGPHRRPVGPVRRAVDQAGADARRRFDVLHQQHSGPPPRHPRPVPRHRASVRAPTRSSSRG